MKLTRPIAVTGLAAVITAAVVCAGAALLDGCTPAAQTRAESATNAVLEDVSSVCVALHDGPDGGALARVCRVDNALVVAVAPGFSVAAQALDGGVVSINPATLAQAVQAGAGVLEAAKSAGPAPADAGGQ